VKAREVLESTSIERPCEALSVDELVAFRPGANQNKFRIVYAHQANKLLLRKGDSVASFGTLTYTFPRLSDEVAADADTIDLPDGSAIRIALLRLKVIVAQRIGLNIQIAEEMNAELQGLYSAFQATLSEEEKKEKVEALT